jgi:hypothetical protein
VNNWYKIGMPALLVLFMLIAAVTIAVTVTRENTLTQVALYSASPDYESGQTGYAPASCHGIKAALGLGISGGCHGNAAPVSTSATGFTAGASCH